MPFTVLKPHVVHPLTPAFQQNLRDFAGLTQKVTVIGCNNHAELWDSEAWAAVFAEETTPENIAAVMEELEF